MLKVIYHGSALQSVASDLLTGSSYTFKIRASTLVGDGEYSSLFYFLIVSAPSAPLNLRMTTYDDTFVSCAWE
jgi:hypothetical protein